MTQLQAPPHEVPARRVSRKVLLVLGVLVVVVAAGVWGGVTWWHSHQAAQRNAADAAAGVAALRDARQDIVILNAMDYRKLDASYQAWLDASTGALNHQLTQAAPALKQQFQATRVLTSGTIRQARVVTVDAAEGTASILGIEDQSVTSGGTHSVRHNGFHADVSLTAAGWRLTSFNTTPVQG
jgi:hypothetical protein